MSSQFFSLHISLYRRAIQEKKWEKEDSEKTEELLKEGRETLSSLYASKTSLYAAMSSLNGTILLLNAAMSALTEEMSSLKGVCHKIFDLQFFS